MTRQPNPAIIRISLCEPESRMVYLGVDVLPETSGRNVEAVHRLLKTSSPFDSVIKGYYYSYSRNGRLLMMDQRLRGRR